MSLLRSGPLPSNELVERLTGAERKRVIAACEDIEVLLGEDVYAQDGPMRYAYFPLDSMFSEMTPGRGDSVECSLTGHEGMVGWPLALGMPRAPLPCTVQGSGRALRMPAEDFRRLAKEGSMLRTLACATAVLRVQLTARNVYCMRHHGIVERLARWLLMANERHRSPRFDVTHKFLAVMLGTRRAGVTLAASGLQARRLIRYRRGEMEILDRAGLQHAACDCYAFARAAQRRTLSAFVP